MFCRASRPKTAPRQSHLSQRSSKTASCTSAAVHEVNFAPISGELQPGQAKRAHTTRGAVDRTCSTGTGTSARTAIVDIVCLFSVAEDHDLVLLRWRIWRFYKSFPDIVHELLRGVLLRGCRAGNLNRTIRGGQPNKH